MLPYICGNKNKKKVMKNQSIYINVCDVKTSQMTSFEYHSELFTEINSEPSLNQFSTKEISDSIIKIFNTILQEQLFVMSAIMVNRHLNTIDKNLFEVVKSEKHNSFTIIIDENDSFVFGSTPTDDKKYSQQHSNFLYLTYKETK